MTFHLFSFLLLCIAARLYFHDHNLTKTLICLLLVLFFTYLGTMYCKITFDLNQGLVRCRYFLRFKLKKYDFAINDIEKIIADEYSNITILKENMHGEEVDVSKEIPYNLIHIHRCCDAHRAYTTISFSQHTIYTEAHYGYSEKVVRKFRKIEGAWMEIFPIKPLSVLQEDMFPPKPVGWIYYGSHMVWKWSFYHKHR